MSPLDIFFFALAILAFGGLAGLVAGLFGVGGGVITVPLLYTIFRLSGISPEVAIHSAIGTSLLTIVATSIVSLRTHAAHDAVDKATLKIWGVPIICGAVLGGMIANQLSGPALSLIFGIFVVFIAAVMALMPGELQVKKGPPEGFPQRAIAFGIGTISALVGVGGGSLSVPTLIVCRMPIHRAIGTASAIGLMISLPGAIVFMLAQAARGATVPMVENGLPIGSFGGVDLLAFALLAPATMLAAPVGARLAHRLPARNLKRIFALFLTLIAIKMIVTGLT